MPSTARMRVYDEQYDCPVCGMKTHGQGQYHAVYRDKEYIFCSQACEDAFVQEPETYLHMRDRRHREYMTELEEIRKDSLACLARAAEFNDVETGLHIQRMGVYSGHLARLCGLPAEQAAFIEETAPMHDIGKIGIPEHILSKPSRLTKKERQVLELHPVMGAEIIGQHCCSKVMQMAASIAQSHHEKWDGSGYPHALQGESIPVEGRIVAICDVFDALISQRPYKTPWSVSQIYQWICSERGKHFDPDISDVFIEHFTDFLTIYRKLEHDHGEVI